MYYLYLRHSVLRQFTYTRVLGGGAEGGSATGTRPDAK